MKRWTKVLGRAKFTNPCLSISPQSFLVPAEPPGRYPSEKKSTSGPLRVALKRQQHPNTLTMHAGALTRLSRMMPLLTRIRCMAALSSLETVLFSFRAAIARADKQACVPPRRSPAHSGAPGIPQRRGQMSSRQEHKPEQGCRQNSTPETSSQVASV